MTPKLVDLPVWLDMLSTNMYLFFSLLLLFQPFGHFYPDFFSSLSSFFTMRRKDRERVVHLRMHLLWPTPSVVN